MKLTKQKNHEVRVSVFYRFFSILSFICPTLFTLKPLLNLILLTDEKFEKILLVNEWLPEK